MSETVLAELLIDDPSILGEGIQWHAASQRLFWTDIHGKRLLSARADGSDYQITLLQERLCSFTFDADGEILAAFESGLYHFDTAHETRSLIAPFDREKPTHRLNDGRCDRQGRFIVGGLDEDGLKPTSHVLSYDGSGRPKRIIEGVGCSNSICFSPDGRIMYFADTPSRIIYAYDYDTETGDLGERSEFVRFGDQDGNPDGSCVDAEGRVWTAHWDGGRVQSYNADGSKGPAVYVAAPQVTCACFGGEDYGTLFITTARENMPQADLTKAPLSGALFAVNVKAAFGSVGLPENSFAGRIRAA